MTAAAPDVLAPLAASGLPLEAQACIASIIEGETPQTVTTQKGIVCSPWNILYSGAGNLTGTAGLEDPADALNIIMVGKWRYWVGPFDSTGFPAWSGGKLANGNFSTAFGGCQDLRGTFRGNSGFGITTLADPQSQIVFNWKLAQDRFAAHTSTPLLSILQGSDSDRLLVNAYLVKIWPGGCDSGFPKRYAANLAALQASPVVMPPPLEPDEVVTVSMPQQGTNQKGESVSIVYKVAAGAALVATVAGSLMLGSPKPDPNHHSLLTENTTASQINLPPSGPLFCPPGQVARCLFPGR